MMLVAGLISLMLAEVLAIVLSLRPRGTKQWRLPRNSGEWITVLVVALIWIGQGLFALWRGLAGGMAVGPMALMGAGAILGACIFSGGEPWVVAFGTHEKRRRWRQWVGWLGVAIGAVAVAAPLYALGYL